MSLPSTRGVAEQEAAGGVAGLGLVPDRGVGRVADVDARVVPLLARDGGEPPLDVEDEVAQLLVPAEPVVAAVALADEDARSSGRATIATSSLELRRPAGSARASSPSARARRRRAGRSSPSGRFSRALGVSSAPARAARAESIRTSPKAARRTVMGGTPGVRGRSDRPRARGGPRPGRRPVSRRRPSPRNAPARHFAAWTRRDRMPARNSVTRRGVAVRHERGTGTTSIPAGLGRRR